MKGLKKENVITDEVIMNKILIIRNQRVMIDSDMAELYGVSTKRLNEAVKRNQNRFPSDFMFQLTVNEKENLVANCDHLKRLKFSPYLPNVFTEHGAVMLASVLNSEHLTLNEKCKMQNAKCKMQNAKVKTARHMPRAARRKPRAANR